MSPLRSQFATQSVEAKRLDSVHSLAWFGLNLGLASGLGIVAAFLFMLGFGPAWGIVPSIAIATVHLSAAVYLWWHRRVFSLRLVWYATLIVSALLTLFLWAFLKMWVPTFPAISSLVMLAGVQVSVIAVDQMIRLSKTDDSSGTNH